ncbi:MAG: CesT family type III secretion system chaperone [Chthoniobacterales bacterium]
MNDLSTTAYFQLLTIFLKAIGQAEAIDTIDKEEGIIEWSVGNLLVRLVPHLIAEQKTEEIPEPDAIMIEADLMLLDLENREVNHDRFLILHQLNSVSLITTGIVAFITEEGMLSITKIIPLAGLDQEALANQLGKTIKAAEELYDGWNGLADLAFRNELTAEDDDTQEEKLDGVGTLKA